MKKYLLAGFFIGFAGFLLLFKNKLPLSTGQITPQALFNKRLTSPSPTPSPLPSPTTFPFSSPTPTPSHQPVEAGLADWQLSTLIIALFSTGTIAYLLYKTTYRLYWLD